jgi:hypothetical protein
MAQIASLVIYSNSNAWAMLWTAYAVVDAKGALLCPLTSDAGATVNL